MTKGALISEDAGPRSTPAARQVPKAFLEGKRVTAASGQAMNNSSDPAQSIPSFHGTAKAFFL
jgi:hypothetical protein